MDNDRLRHYSNKLAYEIDSWDLKVALENGENVIVIDTRSSQAFASEHIPGAMSLPHRTMSDTTTVALDRNALVVTYCDGIGCNASTKGALNMTKLGFRVKELMGGSTGGNAMVIPQKGISSLLNTAPTAAVTDAAPLWMLLMGLKSKFFCSVRSPSKTNPYMALNLAPFGRWTALKHRWLALRLSCS